MSVQHLAVVRAEENSPADRAQRLFAEAQAAAMEQVTQLEGVLADVVALAKSIADGGDIYPAGVRELCRRTADDLNGRKQIIEALARR